MTLGAVEASANAGASLPTVPEALDSLDREALTIWEAAGRLADSADSLAAALALAAAEAVATGLPPRPGGPTVDTARRASTRLEAAALCLRRASQLADQLADSLELWESRP